MNNWRNLEHTRKQRYVLLKLYIPLTEIMAMTRGQANDRLSEEIKRQKEKSKLIKDISRGIDHDEAHEWCDMSYPPC
jgi:hypothetical protein